MLKIDKNISISGQSIIDDVQVVFMNAVISSDVNSKINISKIVSNTEVYNQNKEQVRADMTEFELEVYKIQDKAELDGDIGV